MTDLDLACAIIDDARHAIYDNRGNNARARTKYVLFTDDAGRLVREWEQRKRAASDPTPAPVLIHQHNQQRTAAAGPARAIIAQAIHEEMGRVWTPTLEDAERAADRVLAILADRDALARPETFAEFAEPMLDALPAATSQYGVRR